MPPCQRLREMMKKNNHNVLLLSAGRRVELLGAFRHELNKRNLSSSLFAADLNPEMSAACHLADQSFALPRVTSEGYIEELLALCQRQQVGLVVPTIDTELLGLAQQRVRFAELGIHIVISDEAFIRVCRDKRLTTQLFKDLKIDTPQLFETSHLTFPCFAKPYDGSRSIGAAKISHESDLTDEIRSNPKMMFMEFIDDSFEEFTVDAYFDREGCFKCLVPRHRLEVRDGEISKGVTRKHHVYSYLIERLDKIEGARGCLTVQLFANLAQNRYAALEINPRFGGGYPLSYFSGANYPGWLIDEYLLNKEVSFFDEWEADLMMLRYDSQVMVRDVS